MTGCLVAAVWNWWTWEVPSNQTRMRLEPAMRACTLDATELPAGWRIDAANAFPPRFELLPAGTLGSISVGFSHQRSSAAMPASHDIQFYRATYQAAFYYKFTRIGFASRWYRNWQRLDLRPANLSADEYHAKCSDFVSDRGPGLGESTCQSKARYGRFVSVFRTAISPTDMSKEEMIGVLQAIDRNMVQCVDSFANREWETE